MKNIREPDAPVPKKWLRDNDGTMVFVGGEPTATRMEAAREFRGVELERMCSDLGINQGTYEKWEEVQDEPEWGFSGEGVYDYAVPPSPELMREVAAYLDFPLLWFYEPEMDLVNPNVFSPIGGSAFLDLETDRILKVKTP